MPSLPDTVTPYRKTPVFTEKSVPQGLLRDHRTKPGMWARVHVVAGSLGLEYPSGGTAVTLTPERTGVIEPDVPHRVILAGPVRFFVEFLR